MKDIRLPGHQGIWIWGAKVIKVGNVYELQWIAHGDSGTQVAKTVFLWRWAQKQALRGRHVHILADLQFSSSRGQCHWPHFPSGPPLWKCLSCCTEVMCGCLYPPPRQGPCPVISVTWPNVSTQSGAGAVQEWGLWAGIPWPGSTLPRAGP